MSRIALSLLRLAPPRTLVAPLSSAPSSFLPSSSRSSLPRLLSSLSLSSPSPQSSTALGRAATRAFSSSAAVETARPGLMKRKFRKGQDPNKSNKMKTHRGALARFVVYRDGRFKHIKAGRNQLNRKNNAAKRHEQSVPIFTRGAQTRKLKKLIPYYAKKRRGGGW